jgi:dihydropteroate synthase
LVSQVVNLSNTRAFKVYREKYKFSVIIYHGLYAVELRDVPSEFLDNLDDEINSNIFFVNNDILIVGSFKEILDCLPSSSLNEIIKSEAAKALQNFEKSEVIQYKIGEKSFDFKFAHTMGILNVTPDSFSDGGKYINKESAVTYAMKMIEEGVDIIDVGGESTRPGSDPLNESDELNRVIPVIEDILKRKPDSIISIDTTKVKVAKEALHTGAMIVNDISGGTFDPRIFTVAKEFDAAIILMHMKGKPKTMQTSPVYSDVVSEVYDYLAKQTWAASDTGNDKIIVDPGIGFGKRLEDNLTLIDRLEDFKSLGFPIMVGLSRKSFIGNSLNLPIEDRDDATNALNALTLSKGVRLIRSHIVKQAVQTCKLFNSLIN